MIPKIIHYCWFGRNPKPKLAKKCMRSWKKYCPGYRIMEWNEDSFDLSSAPLYVRQAYEAKKWAFVTDWVRLKVVYDHGGIYLDTDVELRKSLSPLLKYSAYFGFEGGRYIATGLGFGAEKGTPILKELMEDYKDIPFVLPDGSFDLRGCPIRNTPVLERHGLIADDSLQLLEGNIQIFPSVYFSPDIFRSSPDIITEDTISIHWYAASWFPENKRLSMEEFRTKQTRKREAILRLERKDRLLHLPNRLAMKLLGDERYSKLKNALKRPK